MTEPKIREAELALYRRVTWRLIPILFGSYVAAYLDRVNVGFAKLQMIADLGFSDTIYGLGAGIFFLGYFLFEVPSNLLLHRIGSRRWIARIMITWGLISISMMFVTSPGHFYLLRFLLGVAEAGFFPGIIFYLTCWYPSRLRAQILAYFVSAIGVSGIAGGPLSGWIMQQFDGAHSMAGWQWLFLLEGIPSLVMGFIIWRWLPSSIEEALWLTTDEKSLLTRELSKEVKVAHQLPLRSVFLHARVWGLGLIYFTLMMGLYGISFWGPQIIRNAGVASPLYIGLASTVPYVLAVGMMVIVSRFSDRAGNHTRPTVICFSLGATGFGLITIAGSNQLLMMVGLAVATSGVLSAMPLFWTFPARFLGGAAAAAGIALINSLGNLGGFVSPYLVGLLNDLTHDTRVGLLVVAVSLAAGAVLASFLLKSRGAGAASDTLHHTGDTF